MKTDSKSILGEAEVIIYRGYCDLVDLLYFFFLEHCLVAWKSCLMKGSGGSSWQKTVMFSKSGSGENGEGVHTGA